MGYSHRIDNWGQLLRSPYTAPQGHLRVDAYATRTGVFIYANEDGSLRRELRHPDVVFHPKSLATLGGVPVTLGHPAVRVTPDNFSSLGKGTVGDEIEEVNPYVRVCLNIQSQDAIQALQSNTSQVSLVYKTDIVEEAGVWEGEEYTHKQVGILHKDGERYIEYLELALVPKGRAGDAVRVKLDEGNDTLDITPGVFVQHKKGRKQMASIKLDSATYEVDAAIAVAISNELQRRDLSLTDVQSRLQGESAKTAALLAALVKAGYESPEEAILAIENLKQQLESLRGQNAALEAEVQTKEGMLSEMAQQAADCLDAKVAERIAIMRTAEKILAADSQTNMDAMTNSAIKKAVVGCKYPTIKLDGVSEDTLNGMWLVATSAPQQAQAHKGKNITIPFGTVSDEQEARAEMTRRRTATYNGNNK